MSMFLESPVAQGKIEVICGCMFSGKTEELIRRVKYANRKGLSTQVFKPEIDFRYQKNRIVSHNLNSLESISIQNSEELLNHSQNHNIIAIDEAQFFDAKLVEVCKELSAQNKRVILAALDMDFQGLPFGNMPSLIAAANLVTRLNAICNPCGKPATHTFKKIASQKLIEIGESDIYEARCRTCFDKGMRKKMD